MNIKSRKGYTLIELLVVIGIIAVLASVSVPVIAGVVQRVRLNSDNTTASNYESAISIWKSEPPTQEIVYVKNLSTTTLFGSLTQKGYTDAYMGTRQLPGIEYITPNDIRNAVITAIESVAKEDFVADGSGNYYLQHPEASGYGFKYYYRSGILRVEKVDTTHSISSDESYKYWIWLDNQPTAPISICSTPVPKSNRITGATDVGIDNQAFSFIFSPGPTIDISKCVFSIENEECSYTLSGKSTTAQVFVEGQYNIKYYYQGELKSDSVFAVQTSDIHNKTVTISFDGTSSLLAASHSSNFTYAKFAGQNKCTITGYIGDENIIIVPSKIGGLDVYNIATDAFKNCQASRIVLPNTVGTIQTGAFNDCPNLTFLSIPSSSLSSGSIYNCQKLEQIEFYIPYGIDVTDANSLKNNKRTIATDAIYYCSRITNLELTCLYRGVTSGAFARLKTENPDLSIEIDLTPQDVSAGVAANNYFVFNKTKTEMFQSHSGNTVYFSSLAKDRYTAGEKTLSIPHIIITPSNATTQYNKVKDATSSELSSVAVLRTYYDTFILSEGFTHVGKNAFSGFQFKTISLPTTLTYVDSDAFNGNKCLSLEIPSKVTYVGARAFASETLETIIVRCDISKLNSSSFSGCHQVKTLMIYGFTGDKNSIKPSMFGLNDEKVSIVFA